ncbi:MAG: hypothetical protein IKE23_06215, partial [Exiguobacterium sp.]|nr:hypothetical protein [Exiguobacterium sp.]
ERCRLVQFREEVGGLSFGFLFCGTKYSFFFPSLMFISIILFWLEKQKKKRKQKKLRSCQAAKGR